MSSRYRCWVLLGYSRVVRPRWPLRKETHPCGKAVRGTVQALPFKGSLKRAADRPPLAFSHRWTERSSGLPSQVYVDASAPTPIRWHSLQSAVFCLTQMDSSDREPTDSDAHALALSVRLEWQPVISRYSPTVPRYGVHVDCISQSGRGDGNQKAPAEANHAAVSAVVKSGTTQREGSARRTKQKSRWWQPSVVPAVLGGNSGRAVRPWTERSTA